ncbi:MAG: protein kinase, partial [Acidobacteria bacterium]|nr:protein kinase [Acidobacteriota bacterium]
LGAGGMGEVYLAQDTRLGRLVALKMLPAYFVSDDARLRRFQREARAASALNHPNILTIHEVGEAEETHFIATEFIDGQTIRELVVKRDLSLEELLDIATQTASALAAAHAAGIVHRDIKPENIMRRTDGIVKILDFGIAKLVEQPTPEASNQPSSIIEAQTEAGMVLGTVAYMSPEQARGLKVDARTDIWSLGVLVYEMLAGRTPFAGATRVDTLVGILEREPPSLFSSLKDVPQELQQLQNVVRKALRKERSERYQTATGIFADLKNVRRTLDLSAVLEGRSTPESLRALREARRLDEEPQTFAPDSSASVLLISSNTWTGAQLPAHRTKPRHLLVMLIAAGLLTAVLAWTFLVRRPAARQDANLTSTPDTAAATTTEKLYAWMSEAEQLAFIDEQEQRISAMMGEHPVKLNEEALSAIKRRVDRYAARVGSASEEFGKEDLRITYARAVPFVPLIARSFAARKVPVIIGIYLPMIEAEYRTCLENSIGAKGLFQFLPKTAMQYGVAPEEMCDVEKMTPAAAHYIADRMAELGDDSQSMTLVLLSYNRGPEWVRNALRQLRSTDNYERNFLTLFANRDKLDDVFRNENARYVPNFFAAAIVGENPQSFELQIPPLSTLTGTTSAHAKP